MEILICASARAEIAAKCIQEFITQGNITVIAPSPIYAELSELYRDKNVKLVKLSAHSFQSTSISEIEFLKNTPFDNAIVVSGGLGFVGFHNVIEAINRLQIRNLIFYNKIGHKETIELTFGIRRVFERCAIILLLGILGLVRPIELLAERIYIQCAELLGL